MTRILIVNPNTTSEITDLLVAAGKPSAGADTELVPLTAPHGFPYISNRSEAQIGGAIAIEMLADHHTTADAAILAAFGDPGLFGARELFDIPIVGMSEAAMLTACMLGQRFAIVTFASALGHWFRDCVEMHGLQSRCAGIRALDQAFVSIMHVQQEKEALLVKLARRAVEDDGADVVILGGAPLAGLAAKIKDQVAVPLIDPIAAAVKQAETLLALAPRKASAGTFRRPAAKETTGLGRALTAHLAHRERP
jgi:allantoin racemase